MPAQRLFNTFGAADMASGAVADVDSMLAAGPVPEHVIECGHAVDARRGDLRGRTDAPQRLFRQVTIMVLYGLEQGDNRIGRATDALDGVIHVFEVGKHG